MSRRITNSPASAGKYQQGPDIQGKDMSSLVEAGAQKRSRLSTKINKTSNAVSSTLPSRDDTVSQAKEAGQPAANLSGENRYVIVFN